MFSDVKLKTKFFGIAIFIVILDQFTKALFRDVNYGIFNSVTNTGAAFGIFKGNVFVLGLISLFVMILLVYYFYKSPALYLPLAFLLGGATGNFIDRMFLGFVRDFIDLKFWPIFNIADSFNVIGVIILGYILITAQEKHL